MLWKSGLCVIVSPTKWISTVTDVLPAPFEWPHNNKLNCYKHTIQYTNAFQSGKLKHKHDQLIPELCGRTDLISATVWWGCKSQVKSRCDICRYHRWFDLIQGPSLWDHIICPFNTISYIYVNSQKKNEILIDSFITECYSGNMILSMVPDI